jgi:drug/metabolite transporter (DMT)-like permease
MEAWIPITIAAAFLQNLRSVLQKRLKGRLSDTGATFTRFVWAAPLAALYVLALVVGTGASMPGLHPGFLLACLLGGLAQILATALLVRLFSLRNFTIGATFTKTETLQAAAFGIAFLGDPVSVGAVAAILVSLAGVFLISLPIRAGRTAAATEGPRSHLDRSALIGIVSGSLFGLSAVAFRGASLSLESGSVALRAAVTLMVVTALQTLLMAAWMHRRSPGEITRVLRQWRATAMVGVAGVAGSVGWFTAMTLETAAYVRAVGQIELLFAFAASWLLFRERATVRELTGIGLVLTGILVLVIVH